MAEESPRRHAKATGAGTHRKGTLRAAVKPHKRTSDTGVKQTIEEYMKALKAGSVRHTIWGEAATKNASVLRKNFGLAATDDPYLLLDAGDGTGRAGMLLSASGVHVADGRGSVSNMVWGDLAKLKVACQNGMLVVGQSGIVSSDAAIIAALLQQLQTKLAK